MIKVIHLISETGTGGAETMLCRLVSNMMPDFANVVISMTGKGPVGLQIESQGIKVYALNTRRAIFGPFKFLKLIQIFKKEKPDILQTWLYHADLFGILAAKIAGIKIVLWNVRCSRVGIKKSFLSLYRKIVLRILAILSRLPNVVIYNSYAGMDAHIKIGYKPRQWQVINNGFELDKFYIRLSEKNRLKEKYFGNKDLILIGSISRFDDMKDHKTFLMGIRFFSDRHPEIDNAKFVFIGRGMKNNKFLLGLIESLNIGKKIIFFDEMSNIHDIIPSFDIYCSSSLSEGFPNTIGEAMACGIPCVATDAGDSAFLVDKTGIVVPVKDAAALAAAWHSMISMGEQGRQGLGALARKRIEALFSIRSIAAQYEELYMSLAKVKN